MSLVLSDVGAAQILTSYFKKTQPSGGNNLTLRLFISNITPSDGDTATTYTAHEAAGGGYAALTLTAGSGWTISSVNGIEQAAYAAQTFTFTGALTNTAAIYGYFVTDADGVLIWAEACTPNFTPSNNGDYYQVTPIFQLSKGVPA